MDFIEQLPDSNGFTSILVVVDQLTKQAVFIPTHDTITSAQLANLFVMHVFLEHGKPSHVTSDCSTEFVSHFFHSLGKALDMKLHFTSRHHPEGDGHTERVNQTLEQYLRMYCNYQQDSWSGLLPLAEFAYNNAPNVTTRVSPFFANKGYHPNLAIHPERDLTSSQACEFAVDLDELYSKLKVQILEAQKRYQHYTDLMRLPAPKFPLGSQVYVKAEIFHTTRPSKKLSDKNLRPFEVISQAGTHLYIVWLPEQFKVVHPVFHVSQLEHTHPNVIPSQIIDPPPPVVIDRELEFEISEILDSKIDQRRKACKLLYLVRWEGYEGTDEETLWILASELDLVKELVSDFHKAYPQKPSPEY